MAANADPWRTLGLAPGATSDEIRRAYRRLAKVNHPDAAGDAALPRFLAIQAAYEQLAGGGRVRRAGARPPARPATDGPGAPREPWRADPDRARASGRADGRRTPGARPAGPSARPGSSAGPDRPGSGSASADEDGDDRSRRRGQRDGRGPAGAGPGSAGPGSAGPGSAGSGSGGPGAAGPDRTGSASAGSDRTSGGRARRPSGRRRPPNTATPGSTSYEGADEEPFEPGWSGATWYGASSGTYWTINPKEYADPRKHGPEYQARARRSAGSPPPDEVSGGATDEAAAAPGATQPDRQPTPDPAAASGARPGAAERTRRPAGPRPWRAGGPTAAAADSPGAAEPSSVPSGAREEAAPAAGQQPGMKATQPRPAGSGGRPPGEPHGMPPPAGDTGASGWHPAYARADLDHRAASGAGAAGPPPGTLRSWIDRPDDRDGVHGPTLRRPSTPTGRLAMALLGWVPLGVFATALVDQATGCGRYAASCPEVSAPGTWILQAAIVLLLLALPAVAAWSAHGAIAALLAGVPAAIVLSAAGGSNVRETSGPVLLGVLAMAYLGGVIYALLVRRSQPPT